MTMLVLFLILLCVGLPLAFCLLVAGLSYFLTSDSLPMAVAVQRLVASSQSFPLLAVPFFILAGHIMNQSGITGRLIAFSNLLVAWIAGGLAHVTIILSALMGGVSGSAIADAAMQARILGTPMQDSGLGKGFSASIITISALITACIPPSIGLILYGFVGNVSIGKLFIAGIVPGILLTLTLMLTVFVQVKKHYPEQAAGEKRPSIKQIFHAFGECKWALLFPVILIVTIRFGIFTPSEAGAFAVVYAVLVGFAGYKELSLAGLIDSLKHSIDDIGMIMLIILSAGVVGYVVAYQQLPVTLAQAVSDLTNQPLLVLLLCLSFLLFVGMLMEGTVIVLLLTPILVPVIQSVGIDPVHFGVLMMIIVTFGGTTPPVGIAMFSVCNILRCPTDEYIRAAWPFYAAVLGLILFMALFPSVVLFLPELVY